MTTRTLFTVALLWVVLLLTVGTIVRAQVFGVNPIAEPKILSGPDFGIRVEAEQDGTAVGHLVVRINGKWVDAQIGSGDRTSSAKGVRRRNKLDPASDARRDRSPVRLPPRAQIRA